MREELLKSIRKHEGYSYTTYTDHLGFETIGIGFRTKYLTLTEEECMSILGRTVDELVEKVRNKYEWFDDMEEKAQIVLVELAYQIGLKGVSKFRLMLKALSECDYEEASKQLLDSRLAKVQTPNRAKALAQNLSSI